MRHELEYHPLIMPRNQTRSSIDEKRETLLVVEKKTRTARPPMYKVMLLNDDYTPMDFVVYLLKQIFRKDHGDAIRIMLEIHNRGSGTCGVYTRDVAETKMEQVVAAARQNEHPLQCVIEKDG
jgi:ATP-dependent Clp protease adaptor protein ClpS